jgi:hypothetical protein
VTNYIDTNYDGIYESGVKQFSSFEIRFRLNSITPLAAGTVSVSNQFIELYNFTHKNLSDANANKSTLAINAVCVPKDSDNDGIADQLDSDAIMMELLIILKQPNTAVAATNSDCK